MKQKFTLAIPTPCHENWDQFTPTEKGRFCGSCQKEVIDFTTWSEEQIKQYFLSKRTSTCGRFAANQLTTYTLRSTAQGPTSRWAAIITFFMLLVSRPAEAQPTKSSAPQEQMDEKNNTSTKIDSVTRVTIAGVVKEGDSFLPGVNIIRKGTDQYVVTDADGKFKMTIDHPKTTETLVATFIGFMTIEREVPITTPTREVSIDLQPDMKGQLMEIVVGGAVATPRFSPRRLWWKVKHLFR